MDCPIRPQPDQQRDRDHIGVIERRVQHDARAQGQAGGDQQGRENDQAKPPIAQNRQNRRRAGRKGNRHRQHDRAGDDFAGPLHRQSWPRRTRLHGRHRIDKSRARTRVANIIARSRFDPPAPILGLKAVDQLDRQALQRQPRWLQLRDQAGALKGPKPQQIAP